MKTIFVSSTFRDMQLERDALQKLALPNVNRIAKRYGDVVSMCDLRWGVNTADLDEESSSQKVLDVCLDVIDRCAPIMVVILGERYGWIPGEGKIRQASERKRMQLEDYQISVTALEIEYGTFFHRANTLVYFRTVKGELSSEYEAEDAEHAEKLKALKERLQAFSQNGVKTYELTFKEGSVEGVDEFARTVQEDVTALLLEQWKEYENLTELGRELLTHRGIFEEQSRYFKVGEGLKQTLLSAIARGERIIDVYGGAGTGKTTLVGALSESLKEKGYDVLPIQVGGTASASTPNGVLHYLLDYFQQEHGFTCSFDYTQEEKETLSSKEEATLYQLYRLIMMGENIANEKTALAEFCRRYEETGKKLVVLIDGVDTMHCDEGEEQFGYLPTNLKSLHSVTFLLTTSEKIDLIDVAAYPIPAFNREENEAVVASLLDRNNRELDKSVLASLLNKSEGASPLYIKLLLQKLFMMDARDFSKMGDMQEISARQRQVIEEAPTGLERIGYEIFKESCQRINGSFLTKVISLLALSQEGLSEGELQRVCSDYDKLDFYNFIAYVGDSFILRHNGRYDFANFTVKRGILERIEDKGSYATTLVELLCEEFFEEEVKKEKPDLSVLREIVYSSLTYCDADVFFKVARRVLAWEKERGAAGENAVGSPFIGGTFQVFAEGMPSECVRAYRALFDRYDGMASEEQEDLYEIAVEYGPAANDDFGEAFFGFLQKRKATKALLLKRSEVGYSVFENRLAKADEGGMSALNGAEEALRITLDGYRQIVEWDIAADEFSFDTLSVVIEIFTKASKNSNISLLSEEAYAYLLEQLQIYFAYMFQITSALSDTNLVEQETMEGLAVTQIVLSYLLCKFQERDKLDEALLAYELFWALYTGLCEEERLRDVFLSMVDQRESALAEDIARAFEKGYKTLGDEGYLRSAIEYWKRSRRSAIREEAALYDRGEYCLRMSELYQTLGETRIASRYLKATLTGNEDTVYEMGLKAQTLEALFARTGDRQYAALQVDKVRQIFAKRIDTFGERTGNEIFDLCAFGGEIISDGEADIAESINVGCYLMSEFVRNVRTALEYCDLLTVQGYGEYAEAKEELTALAARVQLFKEE